MPDFDLPRTGQRNLQFTGTLIASARSPSADLHEREPRRKAKWFTCNLYQTAGGKWVLSISYRWCGKLANETERDLVEVFDHPQQAIEWADGLDPMVEFVTGFPPDPYWAERQETLTVKVNEDFGIMVERLEDALAKQQEPERVE